MLSRTDGSCARRRAGLRWGPATVLALALAAVAESGAAQGVSGSTFDQPGKLKFKSEDRFTWPETSTCWSKVKFLSDTLVEFGPGDDLASDAFRIVMLFSDGVVRLEGTYAENAKGKIELEPDETLITEDLDDFVLGRLENCKVKARFKLVDEGEPRIAKTKVRTKCKQKDVSPPQWLKYKAKGKGPEITP